MPLIEVAGGDGEGIIIRLFDGQVKDSDGVEGGRTDDCIIIRYRLITELPMPDDGQVRFAHGIIFMSVGVVNHLKVKGYDRVAAEGGLEGVVIEV